MLEKRVERRMAIGRTTDGTDSSRLNDALQFGPRYTVTRRTQPPGGSPNLRLVVVVTIGMKKLVMQSAILDRKIGGYMGTRCSIVELAAEKAIHPLNAFVQAGH